MNQQFINRILLVTIFVGFPAFSFSFQDENRIRISSNKQLPHFNETITIDGVMDEAVWKKALQIELNIETKPRDNVKPSVKTTAYLYEDGDKLYLGFIAEDPEPEKIRAFYRDRDKIFGDDIVGIIVDPSNLRNLGYQFFSNALGSQMDGTEDDLNKRESVSWDGIWESTGKITEQGYTVEMAIPFRLLRLPEDNQQQTWGFELLRFYPRNFVHRISNNPRERDLRCHLCQMSNLQGFETVANGNDIQLVPSLVIKQSQERDLSVVSPQWEENTDNDLGLDIRWGITPELTFNGTINPDFSQVEADAARLSINTRFALFFPEKRAFFLEGAEIFSSQSRLVHTRLIADPDWGVKLTGENDKNKWALFSVNDTATTVLLPGNQSSSLATINEESINTSARFTHSFENGLNLGGLVTNRESDSYSNTVASIDGRWDFSDSQQISAQFMQSDSRYPDSFVIENGLGKSDFTDDALRLGYDYSSESWFGYVRYEDFGKDFRADMGFVNKVDFDKKTIGIGHKWFGSNEDLFSEISLKFDWDETYSNSGELLERELENEINLSGALQSRMRLKFETRTTLFNNSYFDENSYSIFIQARPVSGLRLELFTRIGDQIDFDNTRLGEEFFISPEISWNIGKHWLIQLDHVYQTLDVNGGELFNVTLDDLRITWQKNNRTSVRLTTQYQRINRDISLYNDPTGLEDDDETINLELLYSYKVSPQNLIFVGINSGNETLPNSRELKQQSNLVFVKFSYSWLG